MQKDDINKQIKKRNSELISDYPEIVSKLLLLHGAGLTIQNAFSTILLDSKKTSNSKHYIYQEIELTLNKLKSGASESGRGARLGQV